MSRRFRPPWRCLFCHTPSIASFAPHCHCLLCRALSIAFFVHPLALPFTECLSHSTVLTSGAPGLSFSCQHIADPRHFGRFRRRVAAESALCVVPVSTHRRTPAFWPILPPCCHRIGLLRCVGVNTSPNPGILADFAAVLPQNRPSALCLCQHRQGIDPHCRCSPCRAHSMASFVHPLALPFTECLSPSTVLTSVAPGLPFFCQHITEPRQFGRFCRRVATESAFCVVPMSTHRRNLAFGLN